MRRYILLLLTICSFAVIAEPDMTYDKTLSSQLKIQPCTQTRLPLTNETDVKEAIECDYPEMEIIKFRQTPNDRDVAEVKLYAKGQLIEIIVNYSTGLTIIPEQEK